MRFFWSWSVSVNARQIVRAVDVVDAGGQLVGVKRDGERLVFEVVPRPGVVGLLVGVEHLDYGSGRELGMDPGQRLERLDRAHRHLAGGELGLDRFGELQQP